MQPGQQQQQEQPHTMMQSVLDNLCRCFGTTICGDTTASRPLEASFSGEHDLLQPSSGSHNSTGSHRRRTRGLALNDKQWDALFDKNKNSNNTTEQPAKKSTTVTPPPGTTPRRRPHHSGNDPPATTTTTTTTTTTSRSNSHHYQFDSTLEPAASVAQAKLLAAKSRKRRRSRDDIFRSRKPRSNSSPPSSSTANSLGRFLSKHRLVLANSLCFATPIKDSQSGGCSDDDNQAGAPHSNSMVSDTNTLNTVGDDTINSTLYYEATKLAGLQQTNPPMPLFNRFQVTHGDEIHRIVMSRSHSSTAERHLRNWNQDVVELSEEEEEEEEENEEEQNNNEVDPEEAPPAMIHSSSDSTRSSAKQPDDEALQEDEMEI